MAPPVPGASSHVRASPAPQILDLLGALELSLSRGRRREGVGRDSAPSGLLPNPCRTWTGRSSPVPTLYPCASRLRVPEGARGSIREGRYHLTVIFCETSLSETLWLVPKEIPTSRARTGRCTSRVFPNYPEGGVELSDHMPFQPSLPCPSLQLTICLFFFT